MKWTMLVGMLGVLLAGGCTGAGQSATVSTRALPPAPTPKAAADAQNGSSTMEAMAALRKPLQNEFIPADKAAQCPLVRLTSPEGKQEDVQPGRLSFVTIVVVWTMDTRPGKAAVLHVNDLLRRYANVGVRAVGIVEMTAGAKDATAFADAMQIAMPFYYDDLKQSALHTLAGEVGSSVSGAVPSIFIIDRHLKLRFYRPGFHYSMTGAVVGGRTVYHFAEDAPEDQTIEYYVKELLQERW
jgi:hypothetical protein